MEYHWLTLNELREDNIPILSDIGTYHIVPQYHGFNITSLLILKKVTHTLSTYY